MTHASELAHALAGAVRPARPVSPGGPVHPVPVRVALYRPGADAPFAVADVGAWALHPFAEGDAGRGVPDRPAELVLACVVPDAAAVRVAASGETREGRP